MRTRQRQQGAGRLALPANALEQQDRAQPGFQREQELANVHAVLANANFHLDTLIPDASVAFVSINPFGVAYDALYGGPEHEGPRSNLKLAPEDHGYIAARLATVPELPEDQFYLLTTRIEVIEITVEALRARLEEEGYAELEYTPEDYDAELRYLN